MKDVIICRCSDVTREEIRELIRQGYTTFDEIKRITRAGMGPCQGRTCGWLILREIAAMTGQKLEDLDFHTYRQPSVGIKLKDIAGEDNVDEN
jgi:bacterioferritin-associated ferredoxin